MTLLDVYSENEFIELLNKWYENQGCAMFEINGVTYSSTDVVASLILAAYSGLANNLFKSPALIALYEYTKYFYYVIIQLPKDQVFPSQTEQVLRGRYLSYHEAKRSIKVKDQSHKYRIDIELRG